jgi:hypothetical protein
VLYVRQFTAPQSFPVGHATVSVSSAGTTSTMYFCIWNAAGSSLLWSANTAVNGTGAQSASATQYTLTAGTQYWVGHVQSGGTAALMITDGASTNGLLAMNKNSIRYGTDGTGISTCPSSISLPVTLLTTLTGTTLIALEP